MSSSRSDTKLIERVARAGFLLTPEQKPTLHQLGEARMFVAMYRAVRQLDFEQAVEAFESYEQKVNEK